MWYFGNTALGKKLKVYSKPIYNLVMRHSNMMRISAWK